MALDKNNKFLKILKDIFSIHPKKKWGALIVAVFVWGFIVSQKQLLLEKEVPLQYQVSESMELLKAIKTVKVKVSGPPLALRKFDKESNSLLVNVSEYSVEGFYSVKVPHQELVLPIGVKMLSVVPRRVSISLKVKSR